MRNLLKLLYTYNFLILFLILEGFSLFLVIQGSNFHHARFVSSTRSISSSIYKKMSDIKSYVGLKEVNAILATENTALKNQLEKYRQIEKLHKDSVNDTINHQKYSYFSAKVINNSVNKQYNYITLNKGSKDGVKPDMGVVSPQGIVGVVEGVSENFSTVISVLNLEFSVSAKLKKTGYHGLLLWSGISDNTCILKDIAQHVKFAKGDTVVTTGYSGIFPEDMPIGQIEDYDLKGGNFYTIKIKLFNDFRKLNYVTLIDDFYKEEKQALENKTKND